MDTNAGAVQDIADPVADEALRAGQDDADPDEDDADSTQQEAFTAALSSLHDDEEPQDLLCPITYTLFRDPVIVSSGHTFERTALEQFWQERPLCTPLGGEPLRSSQLLVNWLVRGQVDAWLETHPATVPQGWEGRDHAQRTRSTQEELDAYSSTMREKDDVVKAAAKAELARASATVYVVGDIPHLPRSHESERRWLAMRALGPYDLCDELPLCHERYVYVRRGDADLLLWHSGEHVQRWCIGLREHLGQPRGVLTLSSEALLPESTAAAGPRWQIGPHTEAPTIRVLADVDGEAAHAAATKSKAAARLPQLILSATLFVLIVYAASRTSARAQRGAVEALSLRVDSARSASATTRAASSDFATVVSKAAGLRTP